jgi:hypothetical protein
MRARMSLSLVVLAAGVGSRYGGPQADRPRRPGGATLIDYSIYDARRAGFDRAVLVVGEGRGGRTCARPSGTAPRESAGRLRRPAPRLAARLRRRARPHQALGHRAGDARRQAHSSTGRSP